MLAIFAHIQTILNFINTQTQSLWTDCALYYC